jgi:hypothetical protein
VSECVVERHHHGIEVCVLFVHPIDEHCTGDSHLASVLPEPNGLDLWPRYGIDDEECHLGGFHASDCVSHEVGISRSIDDVDLDTVVLDWGKRKVDGHLPLDLFRVVVEGRVSLVDAAEALRLTCHEEHCLGERCFPRAPMANKNDVADLLGA